MARPESQLWHWMKSGLPNVGRPYHVQRIENSIGSGFPDVEGNVGGCQINLELKVAHYVRKDASFSIPHFTNTQAYWHHMRNKAGGVSWILIRVGDGASRVHYLVDGSQALALYEAREALDDAFLRGLSHCDPSAGCRDLWMAMLSRHNSGFSRHFVL